MRFQTFELEHHLQQVENYIYQVRSNAFAS